jgi:predicted GIY-YIG superfamily endonuclease
MNHGDPDSISNIPGSEGSGIAGAGLMAPGEQKYEQLYLLHFDRPLNGRQHYLGWSENVRRRLEEHRKGQGGKTTAAYKRAGIGFALAATWPGTRDDETQFKRKRLGSLCPLCRKKNKDMTNLDAMLTKLDGNGMVTISVRDIMGMTGHSSRQVVKDLRAMQEAQTIILIKKGRSPKDKTVYSIPNRSAIAAPNVWPTVSGTVPERAGTVEERCNETAEYTANSSPANTRETTVSTVPRNGSLLLTASPPTETVTVPKPFRPESPELAAIYRTFDLSEIYVRTSREGDHKREFIHDPLDIPPVAIPVSVRDGTLTYWHHPLLSRPQREALYRLEGIMRVFHVGRHLHALFFWIDNANPARPDALLAQFCQEHRATESTRGVGCHGTRLVIERAMERISNFCTICATSLPSEQYYGHSLSRETDGLCSPLGVGNRGRGC